MSRVALLLPAIDRALAADASGRLQRWMLFGDTSNALSDGRDAALRTCFEFPGTTVPIAALTRSIDADDAKSALWLRADPSWLMIDAVTVRMLASGTLDLSADESGQLARALQPLFGDAGFLLEAPTPSRWYLRCPIGTRLPEFAAPTEVLGDDYARYLPSGDGSVRWHHLLSEAQIILHNHALNDERLSRGQVPANSLWFWGAGMYPDWVRTQFTQVLSNDPVVLALARAAAVAALDLPARFDASDDLAEFMLIDLAGDGTGQQLDQAWLAPLDGALSSGTIDTVELIFASGERASFKRRHALRFWRRYTSPSRP